MKNKMKLIGIGVRIKLVIDYSDPATPAMVETRDGKYSSTYNFAIDQECIDDELMLTRSEIDALLDHQKEVDEAYAIARKDDPEYN